MLALYTIYIIDGAYLNKTSRRHATENHIRSPSLSSFRNIDSRTPVRRTGHGFDVLKVRRRESMSVILGCTKMETYDCRCFVASERPRFRGIFSLLRESFQFSVSHPGQQSKALTWYKRNLSLKSSSLLALCHDAQQHPRTDIS